jgi:uncharacterized protein (TIGR03792 family)
MVIEWLQIRVPPADQARYIATDAAIWSAALARNKGYLGKEVWCRPNDADILHLVIRWTTRSAWQAVPGDLLAATEAAFARAMGQSYPVLACIDYDVK